MATAADRGWGSGWPNAQVDKIVSLRRADGVVLPVRREVAPMVAWLCDETERRGYNLRPGECWGFANRPIRGTLTASNHSWGLAVDLNAPANPMGSRLITDMPAWMPKLWAEHGWRWGGTYTSRPDAMHYEYMGTPVSAVLWRPPAAEPAPPKGDDDMTGPQAAQLQAVAEAVGRLEMAVQDPAIGLGKRMDDLVAEVRAIAAKVGA